ncbi:MAG: hypothetical protein Q4E83_07620 [bacterium]|nr:hypothetical protein [bacterium]
MNILLLKQLSILSLFIGAMGGVIALIPSLTLLMFLLAFVCPAIIILVYLKQNELIGIINTKEGCIFGAIIGFVSYLAAFVVYAPVSILIGLLSKYLFNINYIPGFLRLIPFDVGSIIVLLISVIFIAIMSAMFNGFSGLVTIYVYELISGIKKDTNENNSVDFEVK